MALRYLWLNGVDYTNRVIVDEFPYVSAPEFKRQVIDIPGANGLLDVSPREVYNERLLNLRVFTLDDTAIEEIRAQQGKQVKVSVLPLWTGSYWRGRMTLPKYAEFGDEHRTFLDMQVYPYLLTDKQSTPVTAATPGNNINLSAPQPVTVTAVVTGTVMLYATTGGRPRSWLLPAGTHRVSGLVIGPTPTLVAVAKHNSRAGTVRFRWEEGELWNG